MIRCQFAADGEVRTCEIVRQLSDLPIAECRVGADACEACIRQSVPQARNHVTVSMALSNVRRVEPSRHAEMLLILTAPPDGVGTELSALIARFLRIEPIPGCKCREHAATMNRMGIAWCSVNVSTIVDWLKYEADARQLPFSKIGARALVCLAIRLANRTRKRKGDEWRGVP